MNESQDYTVRHKPWKSREIHWYSGWPGSVCWEKTRLLIDTHNRSVPALHSSPPTQLSALLTLDLLHIKEHSLQGPSHMQRKIWEREGKSQRGEREAGGHGGVRVSNHTPTAYRSIIHNKSIPVTICLTWQDLGQDQAETQYIA